MVLIRGSILLAIYGISCCYSLRLYQLAAGLPDAYGKIRPQAEPGYGLEASKRRIFEQKLNHFDEGDTRKWNQAYYKQDKYYKEGGPVYLWIAGVYNHGSHRLRTGYWLAHAKENDAALYTIGHRFNYPSYTVKNTSIENLAYLSVPQTLSDYAAFIKGMNKLNSYPDNTKWIVFGSSYGANLAAWMRSKYPDLVYGAVASSAPVLAQMEIPEYLSNVGSSIKSFNETCAKDILLANQKIDELVATENGRKEIGKIFKLCDPLDDNPLSTSVFVDDLTNYISFNVQYDTENRRTKIMCDKMLKYADTKTPIQRYAQLMNNYVIDYKTKCFFSSFDSEIEALRKEELYTSYFSGRNRLYQLCTEFGWFRRAAENKNSDNIFSKNINSELFVQLCSKSFKPSFNKEFISKAVEKTNELYGGLKLNTERILFVHGSNDPWRSFGITSTKHNKNVEVVTVKGGTHTSDTLYYMTYSTNKNDHIRAAVKQIMATLDTWLQK